MDENHVVWLIVFYSLREYMADYMSLTEANHCGTTAFTWHAKKVVEPPKQVACTSTANI
jgi:hypothetical protein